MDLNRAKFDSDVLKMSTLVELTAQDGTKSDRDCGKLKQLNLRTN
ncbi:hypothetical protein NIES2104_64120 [Leptolyngbya sp. NIES-2104]|nr:hypothetical protein NIES2104_64120 [Leptolyngbya sp. NIES-2104]